MPCKDTACPYITFKCLWLIILKSSSFLNKKMFAYCSFLLLFLNKRDLFEKKIMEKDLKDHFPNYQGKLFTK